MARRIVEESFKGITRDDILKLVTTEVSMKMDDIMQELKEEKMATGGYRVTKGGSCIIKYLAGRSQKEGAITQGLFT